MANLGRLVRVEIRDIWKHEASDFTPWLAREENITLLGETIGLDLEVQSVEKAVGPFSADILCRDMANDQYVLIENQIERTDHKHLGQLMTYAAGLHAVTIVWVAAPFTDEHRAAMDWLNEITDDDFTFFALEVELWRIEDSLTAPKFNVVSKPNDWSKTVSSAARSIESGEMTETKRLQFEYWSEFKSYMDFRNGNVNSRKPRPQHWMVFSVGRSKFSVFCIVNTRDASIAVNLVMKGPNAKPHFHLLYEEREDIEKALGESLDWRELPDKKESRVELRHSDYDPNDRASWPNIHEWMYEKLEDFYRVFNPRVRNLNADDYEDEFIEDND